MQCKTIRQFKKISCRVVWRKFFKGMIFFADKNTKQLAGDKYIGRRKYFCDGRGQSLHAGYSPAENFDSELDANKVRDGNATAQAFGEYAAASRSGFHLHGNLHADAHAAGISHGILWDFQRRQAKKIRRLYYHWRAR